MFHTNLRGALINQAKLRTAYLCSVIEPGGKVGDCDLTGTNLSKLDLNDISLVGAQLSQANLRDAYLSHANLSSINLTGANLNGAIFFH